MEKISIILFSTLLLSLISCGQNNSNSRNFKNDEFSSTNELNSGTVAGIINGDSWNLVSGRAKPSFFYKDQFMIELFDKSLTEPCREFRRFDTRTVLISIPLLVGTKKFDLKTNATLAYPAENDTIYNQALSGQITIESVQGEFLEGRILAKADPQNIVAGRFRIPICKF